MAHYARVNNGIVEEVLVAEAAFFDTFESSEPGELLTIQIKDNMLLVVLL